MVQVYPGLHPAVVEASQAAVLYDADDMLERGLRVRSETATAAPVGDEGTDEDGLSSAAASPKDDGGEGSARLKTSLTYTVEGFQHFLRALANPPVRSASWRLPPHVDISEVVAEAELLVR